MQTHEAQGTGRTRAFDPPAEAYPFTGRWFETPEGRLHYLDEGPPAGAGGRGGPAVVMVHGTPTWSFLYRHMVRALRGRYRCIAVDQLGYGLSDKPAQGAYGPEHHARRLAALLEHLGLEEAVLVVHDFGGPIGLSWALEHPQRVRGVVLLNTWMWSLAEDPRVRRMARLVGSPLGAALYRWLNASPRWLIPLGFGERSRLTPEVHRAYLRPFAQRGAREAPLAAGRALLSGWYGTLWARRGRLRELPALLVWGLRDPAFGETALERWRKLWPEARVRRLETVGHFPQEEAPEVVAAEVTAFLDALHQRSGAWTRASRRRAG